MFKVKDYLDLAKEIDEEKEIIIEDCGDVSSALQGISVVLEKEKIPALLSYVEVDLQNPTYVYNMLQKNAQKGMSCLLRMLHLSSYTVEFIKAYDGEQAILDLFKPEDDPVPDLNFAAFTTGAVVDTADKAPAVADAVHLVNDASDEPVVFAEEHGDRVYNERTPETLANENVFMTKPTVNEDAQSTDTAEEGSVEEGNTEDTVKDVKTVEEPVNEVIVDAAEIVDTDKQDEEHSSEINNSYMPVVPAEFNEMMLMLRAMSIKMGILDANTDDVMNDDDITKAKMYINAASATTVRDGVIAVLDKATSPEELRAVTLFMSMFISYMREV